MYLQEDDYHIVIYDPQRMAQSGEWRGGHWERVHYQLLEAKTSGAYWYAEGRLGQVYYSEVLKPRGLMHSVEWCEAVMVRWTGNIVHYSQSRQYNTILQ